MNYRFFDKTMVGLGMLKLSKRKPKQKQQNIYENKILTFKNVILMTSRVLNHLPARKGGYQVDSEDWDQ